MKHGRQARGLSQEGAAKQFRRAERVTLNPVEDQEPERHHGGSDEARDDALTQHRPRRTDEGAGQPGMFANEVPDHRGRGEQVANEDGPPHEGAEH